MLRRYIALLMIVCLFTSMFTIPGFSVKVQAASPNLARGAGVTYTAGSDARTKDIWGKEFAFDGDRTTGWKYKSTEFSNAWIMVDFGSSITFNTIKLQEVILATGTSYDGKIKRYSLQYSNDDSTWTNIYVSPQNQTDYIGSSFRSIDFPAVAGRYVKFTVLELNTNAPPQGGTNPSTTGLAEFEIYNTVLVTGVHLNKQNTSIQRNSSDTLTAAVLPVSAYQSVTWSVTSGSSNVSVDASGKVTGLAEGTAVVRATSVSDPTKYAECNVTVTVSDEKRITDFAFRTSVSQSVYSYVYGTIDDVGGTISVGLPLGTPVTNLIAYYTTTGASVSVKGMPQASGVTSNDFTNPVVYTVTADNGTTKNYTVTVSTRSADAKEITSFAFPGLASSPVGIIEGNHIHVIVPYGTAINNLTPVFNYTGASILVNGASQTSGVSAQNFENTVTYDVYADNHSVRKYQVNVHKMSSATAENLAYMKPVTASSFYTSPSNSPTTVLVDGNPNTTLRRLSTDVLPNYFEIDLQKETDFNKIVIKEVPRGGDNRTWAFSLYCSNDLANWTKISAGTRIGARLEVTFPTRTARYVRFMVDLEDGTDLATFGELEIYKDLKPAAGMEELPPRSMDIGSRIGLSARVLPIEADQGVMWSSLHPDIAAVDKNGTVTALSNGTAQIKATSIANPSYYKICTVTVSSQLSTQKDITEFKLNTSPVAMGTIQGNHIYINVAAGTNITNVAAAFKITGATVKVGGVVQVSGQTNNNFASPVTYTVTAADGTTQDYTVTVRTVASTKDITGFGFNQLNPAVPGTVKSSIAERAVTQIAGDIYTIEDIYDSSITLIVPASTNLTSLVATFVSNGQRVSVNGVEQVSGQTANDFSSPVRYKVEAQDGSYREYIVKVYKDLGDASVKVSDEVIGKSMKYVGYSSQVINEGDNLPVWLKYSGVNSVRYWVSPTRFISDANLTPNPAIQSVADFDANKADLRAKIRANPGALDETYIKWNNIAQRMEAVSYSADDRQTLNDAMERLKEAGIEVIAEVHYSDSDYADAADQYRQSWLRWQSFYATAFYLAKNFDICMFEGPNEPELNMKPLINATTVEQRALGIEKFMYLLKIYSDAIRCAVEDVNALYGKSLRPVFGAPTLASSPISDIAQATMKGNRTDYAGQQVNYDIVDLFVAHKYGYLPENYIKQADLINQVMDENSVTGQRLPVVYTEFNYQGAGAWRNTADTSDTPDVFQNEAIVWQMGMNQGLYGMYQFKYAEKIVGENRNHLHYQFNKFRDPEKDIAIGKVITASSNPAEASKAIDGDTTDDSAWTSESAAAHSLVIDLGETQNIRSYVIELGDAYYDYKNKRYNKIFGNFKLEYSLDQSSWKAFDGANVGSNSSNYLIGDLGTPVDARYIRFTATSAAPSVIKVRDILIGTENLYFDIGGPMKSAEVTRLFALGFKEERPLYKTEATAPYDPWYAASTSYDAATGRYYIWLPQSSDIADYNTTIDLRALHLPDNSLVTVREVSNTHFGEVVYSQTLGPAQTIQLLQEKRSVWLITVQPGVSPTANKVTASQDAQVKIGAEKTQNFGAAQSMTVRESRSKDDHSAVYMKFSTADFKPEDLKHVQLSVHGKVDAASEEDRFTLHVYGIQDNTWSESTLTGENAPYLNKNAGYVESSLANAFPVGIMTFTKAGGDTKIDLTDYVRENIGKDISLILVKEKRRNIEVNDNNYVVLDSKESSNAPYLEIWGSPAVPAQNATISPTTATFDKKTPVDVTVTMALNGNTLRNITNEGTALVAGTDYILSGDTVTIKKEYLTAQPKDTEVTLKFDFSAGADPTLVIHVVDTTRKKSDSPVGGVNESSTGTNTNPGNAIIVVTPAGTDTEPGKVQVSADAIAKAISQAQADINGIKTVIVEVQKVNNTGSYELVLPTASITQENSAQRFEIRTDAGTIKVPGNMLNGYKSVQVNGTISLAIENVNTSKLDDKTREVVGNHPVIELKLIADKKVIAWNNPNAPVEVSIPYAPTAEEAKNPEHIVVRYIDHNGNVIAVPNGKYNAETGKVTFTVAHFSQYAIAYVHKTFEDIGTVDWAKREIEVLASKGVISGTSDTRFAPDERIKRADFLLLLIKTLGLTASVDSNFADVNKNAYYYEAVGIAKKLGISQGTEGNRFEPETAITRQDMMLLTERALRIANRLKTTGSEEDLSAYTDRQSMDAYAKNSMASMVKAGLLKGSAGRLNPKGEATRAETAVLMYRIYNYDR